MIRRQVNAFRVRRGRSVLRSHPTLTSIATRHARAMRRAGYIFHRPDPTRGLPRGWQLYGECVGYGLEDRIVPSWIDSPSHRAVLLEPRFTHIGIGTALDRHGFTFVAACLVEL